MRRTIGASRLAVYVYVGFTDLKWQYTNSRVSWPWGRRILNPDIRSGLSCFVVLLLSVIFSCVWCRCGLSGRSWWPAGSRRRTSRVSSPHLERTGKLTSWTLLQPCVNICSQYNNQRRNRCPVGLLLYRYTVPAGLLHCSYFFYFYGFYFYLPYSYFSYFSANNFCSGGYFEPQFVDVYTYNQQKFHTHQTICSQDMMSLRNRESISNSRMSKKSRSKG